MEIKDVFISYKSEEIEEASWVRSVLENNGISCWMAPTCMRGGSNYAVEIPHAIKDAKVFVLILSSKAQSSQWVSKEVDMAINEGKIVLPFMLENCDLKDDFNFYLTNVQRYTAYENKVAAAKKMVGEIKALLGDDVPSIHEDTSDFKSTNEHRQVSPNPKRKYNICSILSVVFGVIAVAALFGIFIVPDLAAIILSIQGIKRIAIHRTAGKKLAVLGLILGLLSLFFGMLILLQALGAVIAVIVDGIALYLFIKQYRKLK